MYIYTFDTHMLILIFTKSFIETVIIVVQSFFVVCGMSWMNLNFNYVGLTDRRCGGMSACLDLRRCFRSYLHYTFLEPFLHQFGFGARVEN
jgi:hypothetical protein